MCIGGEQRPALKADITNAEGQGHIPGYAGHIPGLDAGTEQTFGNSTAKGLQQLASTVKSFAGNATAMSFNEIPRERGIAGDRSPRARTAPARVEPKVPGYRGYIPGGQHVYARTFGMTTSELGSAHETNKQDKNSFISFSDPRYAAPPFALSSRPVAPFSSSKDCVLQAGQQGQDHGVAGAQPRARLRRPHPRAGHGLDLHLRPVHHAEPPRQRLEDHPLRLRHDADQAHVDEGCAAGARRASASLDRAAGQVSAGGLAGLRDGGPESKTPRGGLPAVSWPWVPAWGSLEPPRRDGENAQKTRKNGEKMGEIRPKRCEGRELTKDQLAGAAFQRSAGHRDVCWRVTGLCSTSFCCPHSPLALLDIVTSA